MNNQITVIRTVSLPRDTMFGAWVASDTPIDPVISVEFGPDVGASVRLETAAGGEMQGRIVQIDPPRRVQYTWHWEGADEETLIDVRMHDLGESCVVEVRHAGFLTEASAETHLLGWCAYIDGLADVVSRQLR